MSFDQKLFLDPPAQFGALKITHGNYPLPIDETTPVETIEAHLRHLCKINYAGVVTNVPFGKGYLENEGNWKALGRVLEAVDRLGIRLWLYDEKGYPSGAAGGLTLRRNPEWEAKGLVCLSGQGMEVHIDHPHGHGKPIAAYSYPIGADGWADLSGTDDISSCITEDGGLRWSGKEERLCCLFLPKPAFDMTHAAQNVHAVRRYVDVMNRDAIAEFIRNTYEAYYAHFPQYFDKIEAIFTDEPSYMAPYINNGNPRDPDDMVSLFGGRSTIPVEDRPDSLLPLYPTAIWTERLPEEFLCRRGYGLLSKLAALFGGESREAAQVRLDFYQTAAELYEENFFRQIGDWCRAHGVAFSGHILLEDHIKYHALYEGNFFANLRHMGVPGIDMLVAKPPAVRRDTISPKLLSSISHLNGRQGVMSESSCHADSVQGRVDTLDERIGGMGIQFACGVTQVTSYFNDSELTEKETSLFGLFMRRLAWLVEGGVHQADVLLYYPIESLWAFNFPSDESIWTRSYHPLFSRTAEGFQALSDELLKRQTDFDVIDAQGILDSVMEGGKLLTPGGERFGVIVLPGLNTIPPALLDKLEACKNAGIALIFLESFLPGLEAQDPLPAAYRTLQDRSIVAETASDAAEFASRTTERALAPVDYLPSVVTLHRRHEDHDLFLFANASDRPVNAAFRTEISGSCTLVYPKTGETRSVSTEDGTLCVPLPGYGVAAVWAQRENRDEIHMEIRE